MSDRIVVDRIAVFARHGVFPKEARDGQRFLLSLDARLDLRPAGRSDRMEDGVSYAELVDRAVAVATGRRFLLIEALAEAVAADLLGALPRLDAVTVRVDKPDAPLGAAVASVAVEITRSRDG